MDWEIVSAQNMPQCPTLASAGVRQLGDESIRHGELRQGCNRVAGKKLELAGGRTPQGHGIVDCGLRIGQAIGDW
jgi:hypothetical protein